MKPTTSGITAIIKWTSAGLFIFSLTQEAYCTHQCGSAFLVFLFGFAGILLEAGTLAAAVIDFFQGNSFTVDKPIGATFTWLANPLLFLAWKAIGRKNHTAMKFSLISAVLMLAFLLFEKVVDNEAGSYALVTSYKAGYWLWFSCAMVILVGSLLLNKKN